MPERTTFPGTPAKRTPGGQLPVWRRPEFGVVWALVGLLLLLAYDLAFVDNFFHLRVIDGRLYGYPIDIIAFGSRVMLLSLGMTLVIATGGVDLSVGAIMAISAATAATIVTGQGAWGSWFLEEGTDPFLLAVVAALGISLLAGLWNGVLVAFFKVQPIIATLVLMVAGRGIAQLITDGQIITYSDQRLAFFGAGYVLGLPFSIYLVAGMFLAIWLLTRQTALGMMIEATGDNPSAARLAGLRVNLIKCSVYVVSGLCAGLAGLVEAATIRAADANHAGLYLELDAIFAVVVGGTALVGGRYFLVGSLIGAVLIQTLTTTMYARNVGPEIMPMPKAAVIVLVCLVQSATFRRKVFGPLGTLRRRREPQGFEVVAPPPAPSPAPPSAETHR